MTTDPQHIPTSHLNSNQEFINTQSFINTEGRARDAHTFGNDWLAGTMAILGLDAALQQSTSQRPSKNRQTQRLDRVRKK